MTCDVVSAAFPSAACLLFLITFLVGLDILLVNTSIAFIPPDPAVKAFAAFPRRGRASNSVLAAEFSR